jgi:hypothetical protein
MRGTLAHFGPSIDRRSAMVVSTAVLCATACGGCAGGPESLPPPPPTVTLNLTSHQGTEAGLCLQWSSSVVDLSALGAAGGNDSVVPFFFHGVSGGFSVATAAPGDDTQPNLAAIAIDDMGNPRTGGAVAIPLESAALSDIIGSPDGGFLAVWTQTYDDGTPTAMYVKRYDPTGAPLGYSQAVSGGGGHLGADTTVVDVAYGDSSGMKELVGSASLDGTSLTHGVAMTAAGNLQAVEWNHGVVTSLVEYGNACYGGARSALKRTSAGAKLASITLPDALADAFSDCGETLGVSVQMASGNADATVLVAESGSVTFLDPTQALVVPTDVVVNGSAVCRVPSTDGVDRAALGWISNVPSDSGGADTFQIAEVSRTGVRSPIGQAALPPAMRDLVPSQEDMEVRVASTYEGDAYMVILVSQTTVEGAVLRCQERAQ